MAVIVDANGSVLDPADNSRGYQTRTGYALALRDLLKNPLAELRSSKQIEFGLEPEEHKITDVKITQSSGSADLDERLISIVRSIVPPKQGLLLAPRAPFTFELLNGKLSIGFTKRRGGAL